MPSVSPSVRPWRPHESCLRADIDAAHAVLSTLDGLLGLSTCAPTLEALLGSRVEARLVSVHRGSPPASIEDGIALDLLASNEGVEIGLEVEVSLAIALTARALKRPPPKILGSVDDGDTSSLAGGLAALVCAVSRRSPSGPMRVRGARSSTQELAPWRRGRRAVVDSAELRVFVDGEAYAARVLLPVTLTKPRSVAWNRDRLRSLGEAPLDVPIVAWSCRARVSDVAGLEIGDAWMLGAGPWTPAHLRGDVVLAAANAEEGARAEFVESGALVLRAGSAEVTGFTMPEEGENDPIVEAVGDVPVVVRVEVGSARMSAREWAALRPGDVVALGHKVDGAVTLRVGGVAVARGELVDIEGEIGVRVLDRVGGERAT